MTILHVNCDANTLIRIQVVPVDTGGNASSYRMRTPKSTRKIGFSVQSGSLVSSLMTLTCKLGYVLPLRLLACF